MKTKKKKTNKKEKGKFKEILNYLIKGIYAGIMIGMGGVAFLALDSKIAGSLFFSIGLLTVCMYSMNLYTGKIGYIINNKLNYLWELFMALIGNFIGTYFVAFMVRNSRFDAYVEKAQGMATIKLDDNLLSIFVLAFFCGVLMYIAVNCYKKTNDPFGKYIPIIMCVMTFILCGFEHCVANMFYFSAAGVWSLKTIVYTLMMVLGNSVGAVVFALFDKLYEKK